ncbi:DUF4003 family protein [Saccharibacillus sacchari]|uniref:DUF4003 family protein n=1 Tax=Saccharibacillus sacchari TaxID=456493 RepID=A0ACC6P6U9_9BACL
MNPTDLNRLQLLVSNTQTIKKEFAWQNISISRLAAMLYAAEDKAADPSALRNVHDLIKESTGAFSIFRGTLSVGIAAMLSLTDDPQGGLEDTLQTYEQMKAHKFKPSDHLAMAAYEIARHAKPEQREDAIRRAKIFYDGMKENHRFLTSYDDYVFAAMLGLSDLEPEPALKQMEQLYAELKPELRVSNGLQSLTQLLVLGGADWNAASRLHQLREAFKQRKIRTDRDYTLPSLGLLALLPLDIQVIADEIEANIAYVREQKGYGAWSITDRELLLLISSLFISRSIGEVRQGLSASTVSVALTNLVIAQQAATMATVTAIAAVNSSSSN